jgi:hypothetical protein
MKPRNLKGRPVMDKKQENEHLRTNYKPPEDINASSIKGKKGTFHVEPSSPKDKKEYNCTLDRRFECPDRASSDCISKGSCQFKDIIQRSRTANGIQFKIDDAAKEIYALFVAHDQQ